MDAQLKSPKSLYDSSLGEVALKNFFAGFMHGLGGFFVTILTRVVLYVVATKFLLPQLAEVLGQAQSMIKSVEKMQNGIGGGTNLMIPSNGAGKSTGPNSFTIPPELIQQFQQKQ